MRICYLLLIGFMLFLPFQNYGQEVSLYQQFNGHYDYVGIGNTLNPFENNLVEDFCETLPSSQAELNLPNPSHIIAAYLYWAGSGAGDTVITLNDTTINADSTYTVPYDDLTYGPLTYFSCFADVTDFVVLQGNAVYQLSDLDISATLQNNPGYCENRTNFAGWAMYVVYEDESLPLNQINLFQGLEIINRNVQETTIPLENLNVIDNENAKIGFLAWEGDNALNYGETLSINGNVLSNPPLNLANNAFNGTNTFTNSNTFYNGDLDVYEIQNNIQIGDTEAVIKLTTGGLDANGVFQADLIILNNIITVLNSQLPDATIVLDDYAQTCVSLQVEVSYTVFNTNSTDVLPAHTPIAFYANNQLVGQSITLGDISIDGFEQGNAILTLPSGLTDTIELTLSVDDDGTHYGIVTETDETNNQFLATINVLPLPSITILPELLACNEGFGTASFNLMDAISLTVGPEDSISFYGNLADLQTNANELFFPENYTSLSDPQTIYVKVEGFPCYSIYQFDISVENCPPTIPHGFSPTGDGINDWFNIQGLYNIFLNHELEIYNRYGVLIFVGNNDTPWDGNANRGLNNLGKLLPVGTYYYVLNLNDSNYRPIYGWIYMNY